MKNSHSTKDITIDKPTQTKLGRVIHATPMSNKQFDLMLRKITEGKSTKRSCKEIGISIDAWYDYMLSVAPAELRSYNIAKEAQADSHFDKVIDIIEDTIEGKIDPRAARAGIEGIKWTTSILNKEKYSQRIDKHITHHIDIADAIVQARNRMVEIRTVEEERGVLEYDELEGVGPPKRVK